MPSSEKPRSLVGGSNRSGSVRSSENERKSESERTESFCNRFGLPLPQEVYCVQRDYNRLGNANLTQFSLTIPEGLSKWIDAAQFDMTIATINANLEKAERINCGVIIKGACNCFTCYVFQLCSKSRVEKACIKIRNFIREQNRTVYHPKGLHIVDPVNNGLRYIEIRSITYRVIKSVQDSENTLDLASELYSIKNPNQF